MTDAELVEIEARAKQRYDCHVAAAARVDVPALVAEVRRLRAWQASLLSYVPPERAAPPRIQIGDDDE